MMTLKYIVLFLSLAQKLAFMVSLGLVTHDHLEGKKRDGVGWVGA